MEHKNHIVIYTKPNCIQCKMSKQLLDKLHYPYSDNYYGNKDETNLVDITSSNKQKRIWSEQKIDSLKRKTKLRTMPILKVRDNKTGEILDTWGGFQPSKIKYWFEQSIKE